jgi:hypothetical protein
MKATKGASVRAGKVASGNKKGTPVNAKHPVSPRGSAVTKVKPAR